MAERERIKNGDTGRAASACDDDVSAVQTIEYGTPMNLDDQMRRYFGTDDLATVPPPALASGLERMRVDLGLENDRWRRFALWALMFTLGAAPDLDAAFKDPADRDAARTFIELSERLVPDDD